jgi:hypothetical protein
MIAGHWQIVSRAESGQLIATGPDEPVSLERVPPEVLWRARQAAALVGDGLYGVDVKQTSAGALVIEVNDNPSIDAGVEDGLLGDGLYERVMRVFRRRVAARLRPARLAL